MKHETPKQGEDSKGSKDELPELKGRSKTHHFNSRFNRDSKSHRGTKNSSATGDSF